MNKSVLPKSNEINLNFKQCVLGQWLKLSW